jgi:beta-lactamase regulating signal transducer with metallopeptidase domain
VKASFLLLLAWSASRVMRRRRSAAERHLLWTAALVAASLLPLLNLVLPSWHSDWARQAISILPASLSARPFEAPVEDVDIVVRANGVEPVWAVSHLAILLWICGAAAVLLKLVTEAVKLARFTRSAELTGDARWRHIADEVSDTLRLGRRLRLLHVARAVAPMTWGFRHPTVLLPSDASAWSDERARLVLTHELAHVSRSDWIVQLAAELICAAYWFNPLFWIARNRLCLESERACDDIVLQTGVDGGDYASILLDVARTM